MSYHVTFGRSVRKGVCINRRESQNWGELAPCSLQWEVRVTSRNTLLPHMCYLAEHGRSALKGVDIDRGEPSKIAGHWGSATLGRGHN